MVDNNESFPNLAVDPTKIKPAYLALRSMNLYTGRPIDRAAFIASHQYLLTASLRLPNHLRFDGLQRHQGEDSTQKSASPGQGQIVQGVWIRSIDQHRPF